MAPPASAEDADDEDERERQSRLGPMLEYALDLLGLV